MSPRSRSALAAVVVFGVLILTGPTVVRPLGLWWLSGGGPSSLTAALR